MDEVLVLEDLVKRFGGFAAVDGLSLKMNKKGIYLLVGPNGCGKTTLINCISGIYKPDRGYVYYKGEDVTGFEMHKLVLKGLVRTFQTPAPFLRLTVLDNMLVASQENVGEHIFNSLFKFRWIDDEKKAINKAFELIELLDLEKVWDTRADELSGGQLKLLEIGRVLMAGGKTLLLDEPVGSIAPQLCHDIFAHITRLRDELGITFLTVEHRLEVAAKYVDHVFAMIQGKLVCEGTPEEVLRDPTVISSYLGEKNE